MKAIVVSFWFPDDTRSKHVYVCDDSKVEETIRDLGTEIEKLEVLDASIVP